NIHMSSPINSGMSGGPTLSRAGEVVGVNVSILVGSQNISFSIPIHLVKAIAERFLDKGKKLDKKTASEIIKTQLTQVQESLSKDLIQNAKADFELGGWGISRPSDSLKCWLTNNDERKKRYKSLGYICYLNQASFIRDDVYSGSFEVSYETLENRKY